jgi:hypothetical protein
MLSIGRPAWHGFHPFGDIIHSDQDILAIMRLWERYHIVDAPYIKEFDLKIIC